MFQWGRWKDRSVGKLSTPALCWAVFLALRSRWFHTQLLVTFPSFEYQRCARLLVVSPRIPHLKGNHSFWKGHSLFLHNAGCWRLFKRRENVEKERYTTGEGACNEWRYASVPWTVRAKRERENCYCGYHACSASDSHAPENWTRFLCVGLYGVHSNSPGISRGRAACRRAVDGLKSSQGILSLLWHIVWYMYTPFEGTLSSLVCRVFLYM